ncbi:MAG: DUF4124 domain-containing protein [Thermomonas sp.]
MRLPVLTICLLAATAGVQAQSQGVYKWKDARGVTHYSDQPPPGGKYANVEANASARVAAPKPPTPVDPRCTTARNNIERLKTGDPNIGLDADRDGKADAPLPESQRADQLRLAEASARNFCKPAGA